MKRKAGEEHVTLRNFVRKFGYTNRESAYSAYDTLIKDSQIEARRSKRLRDAFNTFKGNAEKLFWSSMESRVDTTLTSRKAGMVTRAVGIRQATLDYERFFEDVNLTEAGEFSVSSGADERDFTNDDVEASMKQTKSSSAPAPTRRARYWDKLQGREAESSQPVTTLPPKRRRSPSPISHAGHVMPNPFLSPSKEAHDQHVFKALNQTTEWQERGVDYLALFREYQRTVNDEVFASLANDLIADLTPLSSRADSFPHFIMQNKGLRALKASRRARESTCTVNDKWPAFMDISSRVFSQDVQSYEDVRKKLAEEDQLHPMVMYMQSILLS
ncbi:hypothetical protein EC957_001490 [Mortierella hygrophila]|uniref:Uncharacterized protein n=1 Tax=Mortierella hygrophila TaxID=979708 RepID=A0A9P6K2B4_9FUNG|nr:hypothetical protein EC957_001490 [Mortierella hygrophila]